MQPVFRDYDQKALDDAYDQAVYAPNRDQLLERRNLASEAARRRLGEPQRFAYGPGPNEQLDVYPTRSGAPIQVFVHGGAWRAGRAREYAAAAEMFVGAGAHYVALDFDNAPDCGGDLLGGLILDVAVGPDGDRRCLVHLREGVEGIVVPEVGDKPVDDPVWVAQPRGVVGPLDRVRRDLAQHRVDEATRPARSDVDGRRNRGMRGGAEEVQLVSAEPKGATRLAVELAYQEPLDEEVARSSHARRAVDELGHELAVEFTELGLLQRRAEREVGVRTVVLDPPEHVECHLPRVRRPIRRTRRRRS